MKVLLLTSFDVGEQVSSTLRLLRAEKDLADFLLTRCLQIILKLQTTLYVILSAAKNLCCCWGVEMFRGIYPEHVEGLNIKGRGGCRDGLCCSPFNPLVQHRNQHQRQERGAENAADYDRRERTLHFRSCAGGDGHRHEPKAGHESGHQHRTQTSERTFDDASRMAFPLRAS